MGGPAARTSRMCSTASSVRPAPYTCGSSSAMRGCRVSSSAAACRISPGGVGGPASGPGPRARSRPGRSAAWSGSSGRGWRRCRRSPRGGEAARRCRCGPGPPRRRGPRGSGAGAGQPGLPIFTRWALVRSDIIGRDSPRTSAVRAWFSPRTSCTRRAEPRPAGAPYSCACCARLRWMSASSMTLLFAVENSMAEEIEAGTSLDIRDCKHFYLR